MPVPWSFSKTLKGDQEVSREGGASENKTVSKSLSQALCVVLADYWMWEEVMGIPKFIAVWLKGRVVPRTYLWYLNWAVLWNWALITPGGVRIEVNCRIHSVLYLEYCRYPTCLMCNLVTIISFSIWPSRWSFCGRWMNSMQRFMSN